MTPLLVVLTLVLLAGHALQARAIHASTDPVRDEPPITAEDKVHWAFKPLQNSQPKKVTPSEALDGFIDQKLTRAGLKRSPQADAATLIRRVTFDLTGLPPTSQEVRDFVQACGSIDGSAIAYEALVDRLLASPRYGEHWAQSWLDLARFAETDGFEHDRERNRAWQFRDWVIGSLNRDMPFDGFVRQQIAGDLLPQGQPEATGFLFAGPDMPDINNQDERRHVVLNDITSTVGSAFLGLTVGCAQCHDHPYDPISQADFYRLRAFFNKTVNPKLDRQLGPSVREFTDGVPASAVYVRGDFRRPASTVEAAFPRIASIRSGTRERAETPEETNERKSVDVRYDNLDRVALAHWLTRSDNALFLRTTVNRIWQQHFGKPLAGPPADLGRQGEPPTHPELLDWLAGELPRQQWSLKRLHKVIMMSATYRQATQAKGMPSEALDLYAAMPRKRLTGEMLRDALLSAAGQLNGKAGGPGVRLPLPAEIASTLLKKQDEVTEDPAEHRRRSIYTFARRNARHPLFDLFDRPDALMSCARRGESITAPQALLLMNSDFALSMAQELAELGMKEAGSTVVAIVEFATWRCYSRPPTAAELKVGREFIERQTAITSNLRNAVADYCLALLNANEFIYID